MKKPNRQSRTDLPRSDPDKVRRLIRSQKRQVIDLADLYARIDEARQEPVTGKDRGPIRVQGMTIEERIERGLVEIVEVRVGIAGRTRQKAVRSKYSHPLDKYLVNGWLGEPTEPHGDGYQRHDAGMVIHKHFMYALASPKIVRTYDHFSTAGGLEEWSARRLDARQAFNAAMADLNYMGQRIVLSLCCLAEGLTQFDQEMMQEDSGWRPRFAMARLIEALDDLRDHYRRNPEPKSLLG